MDVTVSQRREGSPAAPDQAERGARGLAPRRPRPPWVRTLVTALVAATSGAVAGAVVAAHRDRSPVAVTAPGTGALAHLATPDVAGIAAAVAPAVVSIRTRPADIHDYFESSSAAGVGTGTVIRSDGTIVTSAMLVAGAHTITVTLADGRSFAARVLGSDPMAGIAVLKVAASGLSTARLAASARLRVGDDVVALGDPLALPGGPTVTRGVVAALQRSVAMQKGGVPPRLTGLVEVSAALGSADAGGPVVDTDGEVVGVATIAANGDRAPGFAVDVVRERAVIAMLEKGTTPADALGADAIDVTPVLAHSYALPVESGALVATVVPGSPADRAGLRPYDIVVGFARQRVATAEDLARRVSALSVTNPPATNRSGIEVRLSVLRGRQPLTLTVHFSP
jgi:serine protease Do